MNNNYWETPKINGINRWNLITFGKERMGKTED